MKGHHVYGAMGFSVALIPVRRKEKMKRKVLRWSLSVLLGLCVAALSHAAEEQEKPTASVDVGVFSKYVWRGYEFSKDSVVVQPSMTVGFKGVSLNLWGNFDSDTYGDERDESKWNETDLTLAYEKSIGILTLSGGFIYYALDGVDDSREFYASLSVDTLLSPTISVYREVAHLPSWYINLGLSHGFELPKGITLDLSASAGYYSSDDDDFVEVDKDGNPTGGKYKALHDGKVSAGLTIPLMRYLTVSPSLSYSFPLSSKADDLLTATSLSRKSDFLYGGVTVSFSF
jgi:hypothetical protein